MDGNNIACGDLPVSSSGALRDVLPEALALEFAQAGESPTAYL